MAYVDLQQSAEPAILEPVVALNRLGKVANRVYSAALERIEAVVEKPRKFYIPGQNPTNTRQGSPAFNLDGNVIGVFVMRSIKNTDSTGGGFFSGAFGGAQNMTPIILPAADIIESASQVPAFDEAPAPDAPSEEADPSVETQDTASEAAEN